MTILIRSDLELFYTYLDITVLSVFLLIFASRRWTEPVAEFIDP